MILTVAEVRREITTEKDDQALEARLQALESSIKGYTHNNFKRVLEKHGGEYPPDVKLGVIELMRYDLRSSSEIGASSRAKIGVAAETLSRHSVTYESNKPENFEMCYPKNMLGFLSPYMCAQFGEGVEM